MPTPTRRPLPDRIATGVVVGTLLAAIGLGQAIYWLRDNAFAIRLYIATSPTRARLYVTGLPARARRWWHNRSTQPTTAPWPEGRDGIQ